MALVETFTPTQRAEQERRFMRCRANRRHQMETTLTPAPGWTPPNSPYWRGAKYVLHKQCEKCGMWRHIAIDYRFSTLTSYYDPAPGYAREPGEGRFSPEDLNRWLLEDLNAVKPKQRRLRRVQ